MAINSNLVKRNLFLTHKTKSQVKLQKNLNFKKKSFFKAKKKLLSLFLLFKVLFM